MLRAAAGQRLDRRRRAMHGVADRDPPRRRRHHPDLLREGGCAPAGVNHDATRARQRPPASRSSSGRGEGAAGRRQLAGARLPRGRRHPAVHRPRRRLARLRRGRPGARRLHRFVGSDDPGPRAPGGGRGGASSRPGPASSFGAPSRARSRAGASADRRLMPAIEMVRMVNSGTEATMAAVRLARAATGRPIASSSSRAAITATPTRSCHAPARAPRPSARPTAPGSRRPRRATR